MKIRIIKNSTSQIMESDDFILEINSENILTARTSKRGRVHISGILKELTFDNSDGNVIPEYILI